MRKTTTLIACVTAAMLALPAAVALLDETVPLPDELQELTGCENLRVIVTEEGEASVYFFNEVVDPQTGEIVEEECDPLA